jgi:copper(I)-binding protein
MLKPFAVGDTVEFTLRYRDGQETIIAIEKSE